MALSTRTVFLLQKILNPTASAELITALNAQAGGTTTTALSDYTLRALRGAGMEVGMTNDLATFISGSTSSNTAVAVGTGADSATNISSANGHDAKFVRNLGMAMHDWYGAPADIMTALGG